MEELSVILDKLSKVNQTKYIPLAYATNIHNEYGFMSYYTFVNRLGNKGLYIDALYCPNKNKYWQEEWDRIAQEEQCKYIVFNTKRKPKSIKKLFGFELSTYTYVKEVE